MSELSTLAGKTFDYTLNNKSYRVRLMTYDLLAEYEKAIYQKKLDELLKRKAILEPSHYHQRLDQLFERYDNGEFGLGGTYGRKFMDSVPGMILLCSIILNCDEKEAGQIPPKDLAMLVNFVKEQSFTTEAPTPGPKG